MGSQISTANAINSLVKQPDSQNVSQRVFHAIQSAASKTGVDFSYLMQKASQESSFDPSAKASTSSATGLFQFTSQTWLHMVKNYGNQYGLGNYAAQITQDSDGRLTIENTAARQAILALRHDPQISAEMAGELDKENAAVLEQKVGGKIGGTELYLAHFLGAGGASQFIRQMRQNPKGAAADILPTAAAANQSVFYNKSGEARSLQQIYQRFAQKFDSSLTSNASATKSSGASFAVASAGQISMDLARLMPLATAATTQRSSVADASFALRSQTKTGNMTLASAGMSTLFDAMIFGQIQGTGLHTTSPLSAFDEEADEKKKNAYSVLSAVA